MLKKALGIIFQICDTFYNIYKGIKHYFPKSLSPCTNCSERQQAVNGNALDHPAFRAGPAGCGERQQAASVNA